MDMQTILAEVDEWPVEDRMRLIEAVWDSLESTPGAARLTPAQEQDLRQRIEESRSNPKAGSPWEEVKARLKGKAE